MAKIVARLTANNQIKINHLREYRRRSPADNLERRRAERLAQALEGLETARRRKATSGIVDRYVCTNPETGYKEMAVLEYDGGSQSFAPVFESGLERDLQAASLLLALRKKSQESKKAHSSWGQKRPERSFTKRGRHKLLEVGAALDKAGCTAGSEAVTLTIPGSTPEALDVIARWSGWLTNRLNQTLRDIAYRETGNQPHGYFYVWELQKRGALHLHYCLVGYPSRHGYQLLETWFRLLQELGASQGIDLFRRARGGSWADRPEYWQRYCQPVRKGVAKYFAKYCSKAARGADVGGSSSGGGSEAYQVTPGRWYGISKSLRELAKDRRVEFEVTVTSEREALIVRNRILNAIKVENIVSQISWEFSIQGDFGTIFCSGEVDSLFIEESSFDGVLERLSGLKNCFRDSEQISSVRMPTIAA